MLKNSTNAYGWPSIIMHWLSAILIIGLFALGLYMVELTYYDDWYHQSTHWHESLGVLFAVLLVARLIWRQLNPKPTPIAPSQLQQRLATWAHHLFYLLMIAIPVSGYLISTADGHEVKVFEWFALPSVSGDINNLATISGDIHYWLSIAIIGLTLLHIAAALKHHFIDKDDTLKRIFKTKP
jgi:cytochrome b561